MDKAKLGRLSENVDDRRRQPKQFQSPSDTGRGAGPGPGSTDGFMYPSKAGGPGIGSFGNDGSYSRPAPATVAPEKRVTVTERKAQPKAPTTHKFEN